MSLAGNRGIRAYSSMHDGFGKRTGARKSPTGSPFPMAGLPVDLSSQMHAKASMSIAATDAPATNSFMGYAVIAALVIAAIYFITQA